MPFACRLLLERATEIEIFRNPSRREWRELVLACDPLDGVRGFVTDQALYAWPPPALHSEVEMPLIEAAGLAAQPRAIPVAIFAVPRVVVITSSATPVDEIVQAQREYIVATCQPLLRCLGQGFETRWAGAITKAA